MCDSYGTSLLPPADITLVCERMVWAAVPAGKKKNTYIFQAGKEEHRAHSILAVSSPAVAIAILQSHLIHHQ